MREHLITYEQNFYIVQDCNQRFLPNQLNNFSFDTVPSWHSIIDASVKSLSHEHFEPHSSYAKLTNAVIASCYRVACCDNG